MAETWASGRLTAVYHPSGRDSVTNERVFRRANYDFLDWDSDGDGVPEQYVVSPALSQVVTTEVQQTGQEYDIGLLFGKYRLAFKVVEAANPGSNESWEGLHSFGLY